MLRRMPPPQSDFYIQLSRAAMKPRGAGPPSGFWQFEHLLNILLILNYIGMVVIGECGLVQLCEGFAELSRF